LQLKVFTQYAKRQLVQIFLNAGKIERQPSSLVEKLAQEDATFAILILESQSH
jgi:hypothetical protein